MSLDTTYNFSGRIMTLRAFLRSQGPPHHKSVNTRHYSSKRRSLEYKKLATPKRTYTLWWINEAGRDFGYDVPKSVWDTHNVTIKTFSD